jgi:hypothetical protein
MGIDRERKPRHAGFHRKEKPAKAQRPSPASSRPTVGKRRADNHRVPDEGPIRIFFDDEREMPEGFVIARTVPAFRELLESIDLSRLHTVCFDWHLNHDHQTVAGESGHDAVAILVDMIEQDHERFSGLSSIWLHSTDLKEAIAMARKLDRCLFSEERKDFFDDVYVLPDTYSPRTGI